MNPPNDGPGRLRPSSPRLRTLTAQLLLLAVVASGAWLRTSGLRWDAGKLLHPDERFLAMVAAGLDVPSSPGQYLDEARSPLNPRNRGFGFFAYGTLPTSAVALTGRLAGKTDVVRMALIGRLASACADTAVIVLLFALGLVVFADRRVALAGSALYAAAVLPIQQAHFFTVDTFAALFSTAALLGLVVAARTGRWIPWLWSGAAIGLALASKVSVAPLAGVAALVAAARLWPRLVAGERGRALRQEILPLLASGLAALVVLRLASPDMFATGVLPRPSARWLANLREVRQLVSGAVDFPPSHQWAGRIPLWDSWRDTVLWGLGFPLGIAAWVGLPMAFWQLRRRRLALAAPVAWIALVFVQQGTQFMHAMRYLLPIYPALVLCAAWGLVALADRIRSPRSWRPLVTWLPLATVLAATWGWAFAFTGIYRRPHTRVAASAWIYDHATPGATLAVEHWDDALPLRLGPERTPARFARVTLDLYAADTRLKLEKLVADLDRCDYVVLSSDRLIGSIPRLPMRYPMTTRYYDALTSGALGFDLAAEITSRPGFGALVIDDSTADESFSVYDHPRVRIFRKNEAWSAVRARALLGAVDWGGILQVLPRDVGRLPNLLRLPESVWTAQREGGTWSADLAPGIGLFASDGFAARHPVLVWVAVVEWLGWCAWPMVAIVFRRAPDRGWLLSRSVGLLAVSYLAWLGASLGAGRFTVGYLVLALAVVITGSALAVRQFSHELWSCLRRSWRWFGVETALFWVAFTAMLLVRMRNPDLWHPWLGGEKPMDLALLNALVRTEVFPAFDPWFAGGTLNYYYFGFAMIAALVKLTGVVPATAYGLAVATLFAMTASGAFAVGQALSRALNPEDRDARTRLRATLAGLLALAGVALLGNLAQARVLASGAEGYARFWNASRAITVPAGEVAPITEFPVFTFLFADLHAHMIGLPFVLLTLALAVELAARGRRARYTLALAALVLGALFPINAWDQPTGLAVLTAGLLVAFSTATPSTWPLGAWSAAWRTAGLLLAGPILFLPFHMWFGQAYSGVAFWHGPRTGLLDYLTVHGVFLAVLVPGLAWGVRRWRGAWGPGRRLLVLLALFAFALTLAVEFVVVRGDVGRMNTVFKIYLQVWLLWGTCAGVVLAELVLPRSADPSPASAILRRVAIAAGTLAWIAGLAYPVTAIGPRLATRFDGVSARGLDGEAYLDSASHDEAGRRFALRDDAELIGWMRGHLQGTPVILEAQTPAYRWGGRISANTGLPTVLGWSWHARQQRAALTEAPIARRERDIRTIYDTEDPLEAQALLARYRVEYVVVAPLERAIYRPEGLAKFERGEGRNWTRVYASGDAALYRVGGS